MSDKPTDRIVPMTSVASGAGHAVLPDVYFLPVQIVNISFIGAAGSKDWILVDAGVPKSGKKIIEEAEGRFGNDNPPKAIILTHGHFDHVGAIDDLLEKWQVPVYAHKYELPYLTGKESYPEPDPTVEGGGVAKISKYFPNEPIDISGSVEPLPEDGSMPFLPDWEWVHTPGHTKGHISLFRPSDKVLIAGDAFVNVRQDSIYKVITQQREINGPPTYFTPDWESARESVKILNELKPEAAITGHGWPLVGEELTGGLEKLANDFDKIAVPEKGKYVDKDKKRD